MPYLQLLQPQPLLMELLRTILVVIDKNLDPLGKGYHANRAKVAFQNGGFFGQGLLNGKTVQGETLPAKHTDFIFAACGEELGFIGCALIIVLLSLIIFRCFYVALHAKNKMGSIICAGICGMMMFQTIENILMCLGLFPVIGLTLPLFSYGGTSVITTFAAMGIVSSIKMRPMPEWYKNSMSKYNTYSSEVTK